MLYLGHCSLFELPAVELREKKKRDKERFVCVSIFGSLLSNVGHSELDLNTLFQTNYKLPFAKKSNKWALSAKKYTPSNLRVDI